MSLPAHLQALLSRSIAAPAPVVQPANRHPVFARTVDTSTRKRGEVCECLAIEDDTDTLIDADCDTESLSLSIDTLSI